tara:strand:+ start:1125 stop:1289 length:165 start_codon:yes stop_codon:yes gene_type:complete
MSNKIVMYDVYQYERFIGRYGEHIRVASYKTKELAKNKAERIWDSGKTPLIKQR